MHGIIKTDNDTGLNAEIGKESRFQGLSPPERR